MSTTVAVLTDKLKTKQGSLSDVAFARKLGVSRQSWAFVKNQSRKPGKKFLKAILAVFPEMTLDVMNYLATEK